MLLYFEAKCSRFIKLGSGFFCMFHESMHVVSKLEAKQKKKVSRTMLVIAYIMVHVLCCLGPCKLVRPQGAVH